jgi:CHAT domain-containing protein/tetratricopeptide (TPR) repeat protein
VLEICEQIDQLDRQMEQLYQQGQYPEALRLARQVAELSRQALGEDHPDTAASLNNLGALLQAMGDLAGARPHYERALAIHRRVLGEDHPDIAASLNHLGLLLQAMGDLAGARPYYERALAIRRQALGEDHPDTAQSLNNLGVLLQATGDLAGARPYFERALDIERQALGEDHPDTARTLNNLGVLLQALGDLAGARRYYERDLAICRQTLGEDHPDTATTLNNLGSLLQALGDLAGARPHYEHALAIHRRVLGEDHRDTATSLNNLGLLLQALGDLAGARPYLERALAIRHQALGADHPDTAQTFNNLGFLLHALGDLAGARPCYERALAIYQRMLGEDHPDTVRTLNNLGFVLYDLGDLAGARPCYERALASCRRALGEGHPLTAVSLNNLGLLLDALGDLAGARPCYERALDIKRKVLGEDHPDTAHSLTNLGSLLYDMGDLAGARPYLERALATSRQALGADHPDTATTLDNLGALLVALGSPKEALPLARQAAGIDDRMLGQAFALGSERQRAAFLRTITKNGFLSLLWQHFRQDPAACRDALDLVLRRKAVLAEAQAAQRDAVLRGKYPHLQSRLQQWSALRLQVARKRLAGPGPEGRPAHEQQLALWEQQREHLEADLAREAPEMNLEQQLRAADRRAVALALPAGVALVEFVRFNVFDFRATAERLGDTQWRRPQRWQPARYLAFVLRGREPDDVAMIDLSAAEPIDRLIADFRAALVHDGQAAVRRDLAGHRQEGGPAATRALGERLRAAVFDPVCSALGGRRQLLLSPDGALAFLPFGVLPDGEGRLLLDSYSISYVNTGRDVLRFAAPASGQAAEPLVVADPDFDLDDRVVRSLPASGVGVPASAGRGGPEDRLKPGLQPAGRLSRDFDRGYHFQPLPGTRTEGERVAALLGVRPWLGADALEGRLKQQCRSPRLLHLATHGFFLKDQPHDPNRAFHDLGVTGEPGRLCGPLPENPLLRAGLALAGANTWLRGGSPPADAEDGLLTAEDVSGLDLLDTELAVLSACQTGLGDVQTGEGVFGLQRAFILAGAKTVVMSLWEVPDDATRALMEDFYRRLLNGEPRAAALEAAQQGLRRTHPEPYFWGAFVCLGNPGPLRSVSPGR